MPLHHGVLLPEVLITTFLQGLASHRVQQTTVRTRKSLRFSCSPVLLHNMCPCTSSKQDARFFQMYMKVRTQFFPSIWKSTNSVLFMMFELTLHTSSNLNEENRPFCVGLHKCGPLWKVHVLGTHKVQASLFWI